MPRYDDLKNAIGKQTVFCSNLGFGEQGAMLLNFEKAIYITSSTDEARKMKDQLDALNKPCVVIDDFDKPFTLSTYQSNEHKFDLILAIAKLATENAILISTERLFFSFLPNLSKFKNSILTLKKGENYTLTEIERELVKLGYKKCETVTARGEFAVRGDILDVFNTVDEMPTRFDFFDTEIESICMFDFLTFEKQSSLQQTKIVPNKLLLLDDEEQVDLELKLTNISTTQTMQELGSAIARKDDVPLEFVAPFTDAVQNIFELNLPIIIANHMQVGNATDKLFEEIYNRINVTFKTENLIDIYLNNHFEDDLNQTKSDETNLKKHRKDNIFLKKYQKINEIYKNFASNLIFFENFNINTTELKNYFSKQKVVDFDYDCINLPSLLQNLQEIKTILEQHKEKQIYLCLNSADTLNAVSRIFDETNIPYTTNRNGKGLILTELKIPYNICFSDDDKLYIGSTNFAHKREATGKAKSQVKYLPKAGEYVVHSTHGIARCEGVVSMKINGVDKEFFKLTYRGGDTLYVPSENADCLSLYLADDNNVTLNKLGGKEFFVQKQRAIKSIEDMSKELIELYAKRRAVKGFTYSKDDYLYTEFENAFAYTETADQLQAIADVKRDMTTGKVMDRLICGDVGFGKTEVAMRAMFKAVEDGKQVAFLAPTTILSLQHYNTAKQRTKDFGVNVEMLNRFRSTKQQKQILDDLATGKINVICGTHRLLSDDIKFNDIGLLILDEEQRFGVKAKEKIKQMKNNVDVLTLSATPIPRTLSMSLMSIRDISIINTAPVNRLPVKTYVLGYNEEVVCNAINDEINRGGQVLVVYNNVEKLPAFANNLKQLLHNDKAVFDIAHGQMSEIALENAIKRLYDKETNVFVSTTLIENGIDLPKANTLIVIETDHLGLSQMYQLRGRVGRNNEQAYAYFTYPKNKVLTEESTARLQAIAENTELGSGFKIAMRDLSIRGAGELLGKTQHGHMIKIGYDMYSKLLNETLRKMRGEKVETERDIKLDIALPSKIPVEFVADEAERLKIIAKISNIDSKQKAREVINELLISYGKLPIEIYHLANIALLKCFAIKQKVKQIIINKTKMAIIYYDDINLNNLIKKVNKQTHFKFENAFYPTISLNVNNFSVQTALGYFTEFLAN